MVEGRLGPDKPAAAGLSAVDGRELKFGLLFLVEPVALPADGLAPCTARIDWAEMPLAEPSPSGWAGLPDAAAGPPGTTDAALAAAESVAEAPPAGKAPDEAEAAPPPVAEVHASLGSVAGRGGAFHTFSPDLRLDETADALMGTSTLNRSVRPAAALRRAHNHAPRAPIITPASTAHTVPQPECGEVVAAGGFSAAAA